MKRARIIAAVVIMLLCIATLFLTACINSPLVPADPCEPGTANAGTTAAPSIDTTTDEPYARRNYVYDYRTTTLGSIFGFNNGIVETDDSVFLINNGYLFFSDKEYKDFMPLCAKPNCFHNDDECDARLDTKNGIWLYGSYIWYVSSERGIFDDTNKNQLWLCRMRIDGTKHERVLRFYEGEYDFDVKSSAWNYYYSNKYLYASHYAADRNDLTSQEAKISTELYIVDLETLEIKTAEPGEYGFTVICWGDGDLVYGIGSEEAEDPDYDGEQTMATGFRKALLVYNFKTDEMRRIGVLEGRGFLDTGNGGWGLIGSDFCYVRWDRTEDTTNLWTINVETGECRLALSGNRSELLISTYDWTNNIFFSASKLPGKEGFFAYSLDGAEIAALPDMGMPEDFLEGQVMFQTDSYIFLCSQDKEEIDDDESGGFFVKYTVPTWFLDKHDIGTDELMWRRWEP